MADITRKELGDALQSVAEQFHTTDKSLAKIAAALYAVKVILAYQMNPSSPVQGLKQIEELEIEIAKLDPTRSAREKTEQIFEMLRIIDKHGGPKQA